MTTFILELLEQMIKKKDFLRKIPQTTLYLKKN